MAFLPLALAAGASATTFEQALKNCKPANGNVLTCTELVAFGQQYAKENLLPQNWHTTLPGTPVADTFTGESKWSDAAQKKNKDAIRKMFKDAEALKQKRAADAKKGKPVPSSDSRCPSCGCGCQTNGQIACTAAWVACFTTSLASCAANAVLCQRPELLGYQRVGADGAGSQGESQGGPAFLAAGRGADAAQASSSCGFGKFLLFALCFAAACAAAVFGAQKFREAQLPELAGAPAIAGTYNGGNARAERRRRGRDAEEASDFDDFESDDAFESDSDVEARVPAATSRRKQTRSDRRAAAAPAHHREAAHRRAPPKAKKQKSTRPPAPSAEENVMDSRATMPMRREELARGTGRFSAFDDEESFMMESSDDDM